MNRRAFLSVSVVSLSAGCLGSPVETPEPSASPPNFFAEFEWDAAQSAYEITFTRGNVIRADTTESVTILTGGESDATTEWVGGADAAAEFPLRPPASITVSLSERAPIQVVQEPRSERHAAQVLAQFEPTGGDG